MCSIRAFSLCWNRHKSISAAYYRLFLSTACFYLKYYSFLITIYALQTFNLVFDVSQAQSMDTCTHTFLLFLFWAFNWGGHTWPLFILSWFFLKTLHEQNLCCLTTSSFDARISEGKKSARVFVRWCHRNLLAVRWWMCVTICAGNSNASHM